MSIQHQASRTIPIRYSGYRTCDQPGCGHAPFWPEHAGQTTCKPCQKVIAYKASMARYTAQKAQLRLAPTPATQKKPRKPREYRARVCTVCDAVYTPTGPTQQMCDGCGPEYQRQRMAAYHAAHPDRRRKERKAA